MPVHFDSTTKGKKEVSFPGFHPVVQQWFLNCFKQPTAVQQRGWQAIRQGHHTLISALTGSGKTLTAFLNVLDELFREGIENKGLLPDETRVLYISPLKALSADIHLNLSEPRREIRKLAKEMSVPGPKITAAVRSGDTPSSQRQAMVRKPPHILVTTPESLYLLLTAERSREILRTVRTVIVDEIHAILESRRGSHLALSLERLQHICRHPLQRIGLSATQKPIGEVAQYLVGGSESEECTIVDEGHFRELDLDLELPDSPLEAVLSGDTREEIYARLVQLILDHKTTLIFVNTRREAERATHQLSKLVREEAVTAHHGSLSKEKRLQTERRLKDGSLKALVATASLELGIDIGHIDLVCQLGSPRRIATFLQRVGRSGHTVYGTPKGRLFPLTRNELVECCALLRSVHRGELDRLQMLDAPLDILAQQIVAEVACEEWDEEKLFQRMRGAYPYRNLDRETFKEVVQMVSYGFTNPNSGNRKGALIHYDAVNKKLRHRRGSRLTAITSGGAIPDNADYRVVMEPGETFVGTVDEDFAVESLPGDIFQLGSTSWQILRIETGVVRVEDAHGEPPTIPFWFGEAPARSTELSKAVSDLRHDIETHLGEQVYRRAAEHWLISELKLSESAAEQIVEYLAETKRLLGAIPSQKQLVLERFFDEAGGMQLILHSPFGNRVNRAWGLALRKRFCRQFNFELQAAATEEGVLLSLGPQHSFPLEDVFRYLHPETVEDVLVQALLDAPMFQTHWRWNASLSLALLRWRGGHKVAPQIQRMQAEDLLVSVFPDAAACLENIAGDREIPDHPLVNQTIRDCLTEVMDIDGLKSILRRIHNGELDLIARDLTEPSPLSAEILTARPYAFLDDAPLEERRAHAVYSRRAFEPSSSEDLGKLDKEAIQRVRDEIRPDAENADELHDVLLTFGFLKEDESNGEWLGWFDELIHQERATRIVKSENSILWTTAERLPELSLIYPQTKILPEMTPPEASVRPADSAEALKHILQSRMSLTGPVTVTKLTNDFDLSESEMIQALLALEAGGTALRGRFNPDAEKQEWCDRRILSRIHRYTLDKLRAEIQPVSSADLMQFLFRWQRVEDKYRVSGEEGIMAVVEQLEGFDLPASAWETDILTARCEDYSTEYMNRLSNSGRIMWGRITPPAGNENGLQITGLIRSSPVALWKRENVVIWLKNNSTETSGQNLSSYGLNVLEVLQSRGASFFHDLVSRTKLLPSQVEQGLGELVAIGFATSDSFAGLRALITPVNKRNSHYGRKHSRRGKVAPYGVDTAGRWSLLHHEEISESLDDDDIEYKARLLLRRYGVVFRRLISRETSAPPWRELLRAFWRLEARGEIRGGRFVNGFSGEQFALPEAVGLLRKMRKQPESGNLIALSAADPLNLTGIITPGNRIPAITSNRVGYRDGIPVVAIESGQVHNLENGRNVPHEIEKALKLRKIPPELRAFIK